MRFYAKTHKHYYGIDLHAKIMNVCIIDADGAIVLHRNIATSLEDFLRVIATFLENTAVTRRDTSNPNEIPTCASTCTCTSKLDYIFSAIEEIILLQ
jgi:hypothetical protein